MQGASLSHIIHSGQHPKANRIAQAMAENIITVIRGAARMFVSRKCLGKVWNVIQARGPVRIWHDMLKAARFHRRLSGSFLFPAGYIASSLG